MFAPSYTKATQLINQITLSLDEHTYTDYFVPEITRTLF